MQIKTFVFIAGGRIMTTLNLFFAANANVANYRKAPTMCSV